MHGEVRAAMSRGVRRIFAHRASLRLDLGADPQAPGAAVTVALCGHWEHEGPCRWPHLATVAGRSEDTLALRVLFAAEDADEGEVRLRIAQGLRLGRLEGGPRPSGWAVLDEGRDEVEPDDADASARLFRSGPPDNPPKIRP